MSDDICNNNFVYASGWLLLVFNWSSVLKLEFRA